MQSSSPVSLVSVVSSAVLSSLSVSVDSSLVSELAVLSSLSVDTSLASEVSVSGSSDCVSDELELVSLELEPLDDSSVSPVSLAPTLVVTLTGGLGAAQREQGDRQHERARAQRGHGPRYHAPPRGRRLQRSSCPGLHRRRLKQWPGLPMSTRAKPASQDPSTLRVGLLGGWHGLDPWEAQDLSTVTVRAQCFDTLYRHREGGVEPEFAGHEAADVGDLDAVLEDVLAVAGAIVQAAHDIEDFLVDAGELGVGGGVLAGLGGA
ncbi:MAG: hypothetical protein HC927_13805, partial [Deltaproteobacteria bacterium]|nr:hypothetical protein [Deltaproteobacteria bacterium]